jgi:hypothetical protein
VELLTNAADQCNWYFSMLFLETTFCKGSSNQVARSRIGVQLSHSPLTWPSNVSSNKLQDWMDIVCSEDGVSEDGSGGGFCWHKCQGQACPYWDSHIHHKIVVQFTVALMLDLSAVSQELH